MNPRVFAKCIKGGKRMTAIFDLVYDKGQPAVIIGLTQLGEKTAGHVLTINPLWLHKAQSTEYEYEYSGMILMPSVEKN